MFFFSPSLFVLFRVTFLSDWNVTSRPGFHDKPTFGFQTFSPTSNRWWTETCGSTAPWKQSKAAPSSMMISFFILPFSYLFSFFNFFFSFLFFLSDWSIGVGETPILMSLFHMTCSIVSFASSSQIGIPRIDSKTQHAAGIPYQRVASWTLRVWIETYLQVQYPPSTRGIDPAKLGRRPFRQIARGLCFRTFLSFTRPLSRKLPSRTFPTPQH